MLHCLNGILKNDIEVIRFDENNNNYENKN
jgi:hypothetical protein